MRAYLVIRRVDEDFVDNLEEAGYVLDGAMDHALLLCIVGPHGLLNRLHAANVRVWTLQDMLQLSELTRVTQSAMGRAAKVAAHTF